MTHKTNDYSPVKLEDSWVQIFGNNSCDISNSQRRERWEEWKKIALENGANDFVEYWTDSAECEGCVHLDADWCNISQLPCTVNPVLTYRHNMIGMACMGFGRTEKPFTQLKIW